MSDTPSVPEAPEVLVVRARNAFSSFHQSLHAQQQSCWDDLDLTMSQFKVLMSIAATGGVSGRDLARKFGVGPSAITATIERLVQRGYVRREEDLRDRRVSWSRPTPAALALFHRVSAGHDEQLTEILITLSPDDLVAVERALTLLRTASDQWLAMQQDVAGCPPSLSRTLHAVDEDRHELAARAPVGDPLGDRGAITP